MAVFKVEVTKSYTVMSNYHLRDKNLSLKAKGLLSQMLSLPEDWDYTLKGLALINREKIDAIREAVRELEQAGYACRRSCCLCSADYYCGIGTKRKNRRCRHQDFDCCRVPARFLEGRCRLYHRSYYRCRIHVDL